MNKKKFLKLQKETVTDINLIPRDTVYCYSPDEERNKNRDNCFTYYIKPCPYYVKGKGDTNDLTFGDQCKSCGENYLESE